MNDGLLPRRYAKALYKLATERNDATEIYEQLKHLNFSYTAIDELKRVVLNPSIPDELKGAVVSQAAGASPGSSLDRFILLVIRNNRAEILYRITLAYLNIFREQHNIAKVEVTTAVPVEQDKIDRIVAVVAKQLPGKTIEVDTHVNKDLIGGFTVKVGDLLLDASVKNELNKLRLQLLS